MTCLDWKQARQHQVHGLDAFILADFLCSIMMIHTYYAKLVLKDDWQFEVIILSTSSLSLPVSAYPAYLNFWIGSTLDAHGTFSSLNIVICVDKHFNTILV